MSTKCKAAIILIMLAATVIAQSCIPASAQSPSFGMPASRYTPLYAPDAQLSQPIQPAQPAGNTIQDMTLDPAEYRAAWVYSFGSEFANPNATTTTVDTLYNNNFNVIIPEIRKRGDAYYNSAYEPWATDVAGGYDPLADMLAKAHSKPNRMDVWGWIVTWRIWPRSSTLIAPPTHIWSKHPGWAMIDSSGRNYEGSYYNLDPGIPAVQQYVCNVMKDCLTKYPDLDGYNFDYIRYPGYNWGYNSISKARFRADYGFDPPTTGFVSTNQTPAWQAWQGWKREQITNFVKKCYLEAIHINPKIKMSIDGISWMQGNPVTDFEGTRPYLDICQNHKLWAEMGIIDVNVLMNYRRDWTGLLASTNYYYNGYPFGNQQADHRLWDDYLAMVQSTTGRHMIDGVGGYMNILQGVKDQWSYARANGVGLGMYRYGATVGAEDPANPGLPVMNRNAVIYSSTSGYGWLEQYFYDNIKPTMLPNPAPVPDMPWKSNPTVGYLFGQVVDIMEPNEYDATMFTGIDAKKWLYKAKVTATGPNGSSNTYETYTDGTGTYGFLNIPPGEYLISVEMNGYTPIEDYAATVTVGNATKQNFELWPVLAPEDFKTLEEANNTGLVPDNSVIGLNDNIVTSPSGAFSDCIYIETPDRAKGLQVRLVAGTSALAEGDEISLIGKIVTNGGERILANASVQSKQTSTVLAALGSSIRDLSRSPSATALLVRAAGKVVDNGTGWFSISDGSGTVKVKCPGMVVPAKNTNAQVVGINCVDTVERYIRVRKQADIVTAGKAAVTAPTNTVIAGLNLIGMPYIPTDPTAQTVLTGMTIDGLLFRWSNSSQAFVTYNALTPSVFGGMCPNEGYAVLSTASKPVAFEGIAAPAADARISCPKAGWSLISSPFLSPVLWYDVMVTDGVETLTLEQAVAAGWIGRIAFSWENTIASFGYVGTGARGSRFDDSLRPWKAYWVTTYKDNLALIVPKPAS